MRKNFANALLGPCLVLLSFVLSSNLSAGSAGEYASGEEVFLTESPEDLNILQSMEGDLGVLSELDQLEVELAQEEASEGLKEISGEKSVLASQYDNKDFAAPVEQESVLESLQPEVESADQLIAELEQKAEDQKQLQTDLFYASKVSELEGLLEADTQQQLLEEEAQQRAIASVNDELLSAPIELEEEVLPEELVVDVKDLSVVEFADQETQNIPLADDQLLKALEAPEQVFVSLDESKNMKNLNVLYDDSMDVLALEQEPSTVAELTKKPGIVVSSNIQKTLVSEPESYFKVEDAVLDSQVVSSVSSFDQEVVGQEIQALERGISSDSSDGLLAKTLAVSSNLRVLYTGEGALYLEEEASFSRPSKVASAETSRQIASLRNHAVELTDEGELLNAFYFIRHSDLKDISFVWQNLSKKIYGNSNMSESLELWNKGVSLKVGQKISYNSLMSPDRKEKAKVLALDKGQKLEKLVVKKGDSLSKIAKKLYGNGQSWKELFALNPNLKNPSLIKAGQVIQFQPIHL